MGIGKSPCTRDSGNPDETPAQWVNKRRIRSDDIMQHGMVVLAPYDLDGMEMVFRQSKSRRSHRFLGKTQSFPDGELTGPLEIRALADPNEMISVGVVQHYDISTLLTILVNILKNRL